MPLALALAVATAAAVQAVAINQAGTLLPRDWVWARDPLVVGVVFVASLLAVVALALMQQWRDRREDRDALVLEPDDAFQSVFALRRGDSTGIRWTPHWKLSYTGSRALSIADIEPIFPIVRTHDGTTFQLVRRATSSYFTAYSTFGALASAQDRNTEEPHELEEWPLIVRPGTRIHLASRQEYEFRVDGEAHGFESDDDLLAALGPYFSLEPNGDGGYLIGRRLIESRIECSDDDWTVLVDHFIMPIGASVIIPDLEDLEEDPLYWAADANRV